MNTYDVVIVGARAAGAATAMLLARQGMRVLLLDRGRYGADALSTHALMRGSVFMLNQWGLLDQIVDAGTPPVRQTSFDYGDDRVTVTIRPSLGVQALYAPRRTVLDRVLVDAARVAGAEVRFGVAVGGLIRDRRGQVLGVFGRDRAGGTVTAAAALTVGADGVRSTVAREVGAPLLRNGTGAGAIVYGYWSDLPVAGYEWHYRPGHSAGLIPTNAGEVCVFAGVPAWAPSARMRGDIAGTYHRMLTAATGNAGGRFSDARSPRRLRTWIGRPSFVRRAYGPGWVLIGDAGSFLDPLSTHGITDALRDAGMLARALDGGLGGDLDGALRQFTAGRDSVLARLFPIVDRIAGYGWNVSQLRRHLLELSSAMSAEVEMMAAAVGPRVPS